MNIFGVNVFYRANSAMLMKANECYSCSEISKQFMDGFVHWYQLMRSINMQMVAGILDLCCVRCR